MRLDDFVNEATIQKIIRSVGSASAAARDEYVMIQEDLPEGWTFSNTMSYLGLGALAPGRKSNAPTTSPEAAKTLFAAL